MNDEIKEILDNFKCYEERYKKYNETQFIIIERDIHLLLDYITNLQETIDFQDKWLEYYKDFISENNIEDYKSRIEKAVDFINKHCVNHKLSKEFGFKVYTMMVTDELEKVMKILENGRSDE